MSAVPQTAWNAETERVVTALGDSLFEKSGSERFGLTCAEFKEILREVAVKYLPAEASPGEAKEFLTSLKVEDLALARACAKGGEAAWTTFLNRYREKLYDAALSIAKEESAARELADSLYADLFGTNTREGRRISKLNSFTGRGSLEGWLRAVLAQEFVNRYRKERRWVSLEEQTEAGVQFHAQDPPAAQPDARLQAATDEALAALPAEDRFILACYYLDGRTLADTARMLGVHEATVSRKLAKITASLRKSIVKGLTRRGMLAREAEEALHTDIRELSVDVRRRLVQEKEEKTVP